MLIMGIFEHTLELEQVLTELEHNGIGRSGIMVVPMDRTEGRPFRYMEWTSRAPEVGMACATAGSVIGVSAGFGLDWGPLIWGLIAAAGSFAAGYGAYGFLHKRWKMRGHASIKADVAVVVRADEGRAEYIRKTMWQYRAISVGRIPERPPLPGGIRNA